MIPTTTELHRNFFLSMPPPPAASTVAAAFLFFLLLSVSSSSSSSSEQPFPHNCSQSQLTIKSPCPPFSSSLPYPFSSHSGCGHPSFQIQCSSPHSTILINNLTFSVLDYNVNSSFLILSPHSTEDESTKSNCTSSLQSITLSSPFRVSVNSCSRLSVLKQCKPPNLPNCSHCPWGCKLVKNPIELFRECGATSHYELGEEEGCQSDVLEFLDEFLMKGVDIDWDEGDDHFISCRDCQAKNGVCGFNSSDPEKKFICFRSTSRSRIKEHGPNRIAVLSIIFAFMCLLVVIFVISAIFGKRRKSFSGGAGDGDGDEDPTIIYLRRHRSANLLPPVFSYDELESSTNRFDPNRKIGDGGFGSVYLAQLADGRTVAVKYLHKHCPAAGKAFSMKSFCNEILILSSISHPNLVKLHGYCSDQRGLLLVHEYIPNGTLADHLHGRTSLNRKGKGYSLSWQLRVEMALQIAMAIEYLHFDVEPPIVHRDITSSNIFVEKDMRIKVGDFGLSRLLILPDKNSTQSSGGGGGGGGCVWTGPQGTPGYLDPDYHRSFRLTEKSDIYSFGVILFELITGMKAVDQSREKREIALADMVVSRIQMGLLHQVVDTSLLVEWEGTAVEIGVAAVAELAFRCVAADKDDRPDAREIVAELRRIRSRGRGVVGVSRASSNSSSVVVPES